METEKKHVFPDAFMLMLYACPCGHRESIWNSRDGVVPFGMGCPSCGGPDLVHVTWKRDLRIPDYRLHPFQKFWRDGTPDEAAAIMRRRIAVMRPEFPITDEEAEKLIADAREGVSHEFQKGWPMLDAKGEDMETLASALPVDPWEVIGFCDAVVFTMESEKGRASCGLLVEVMLKKHGPGIRIVYRDHMGNWNELCHDGGSFSGYRPTNLRPPQMTS